VSVNDYNFGWTVAIGRVKDGLLVASEAGPECHVMTQVPLRECLTVLGTHSGQKREGLQIFCVLEGHDSPLGHAHIEDLERPRPSSIRPIASLGPGYVAADAAIGPPGRGSPLVVAAVTASDSGALVTLLRVTPGGEIAAKAELLVPGSMPLAPLAVNVDRGGRIDAAFVSRPTASHALELIQVMGKLDHLPPAIHRTPIPGAGKPNQILVSYGNVDQPHLPGVFLRGPGTEHRFFHPGRRTETIHEAFRAHDALALYAAHGWYLLANDGVKLRWVELERASATPGVRVPVGGDPILP
jgi:hypothetical protein